MTNIQNGFRIQLDMSSIFEDNRKKSCIFVDRSMKCIGDLQKKINRLFSLKSDISTMIFDNFVHPDESIQVLQENDVLKVTPIICEESSECKSPTDFPVKSNQTHWNNDFAHGQTSKSSKDLFCNQQNTNDKSYYRSNSLAHFIQALNGERSMCLDVPVESNTSTTNDDIMKSDSMRDRYQKTKKNMSIIDKYQNSVKSSSVESHSVHDEIQESAYDEYHDTASEMSFTETKTKRKRKRHHKKKKIDAPLPPSTLEVDILPMSPRKSSKAKHIHFGDDFNSNSEELMETCTGNEAEPTSKSGSPETIACSSSKKFKKKKKIEDAMESHGSTDSSDAVEVIYEKINRVENSSKSEIPKFGKIYGTERKFKIANSSENISQNSTRSPTETKFRASNLASFKKRKLSDEDLFGVEYADEITKKNCKSSPDMSHFKQLISASYRRAKENRFKSEEEYEFAIRELMMSLEYPLVPRFQLNDRSNKKMDVQPQAQICELEASVDRGQPSSDENYLPSKNEKIDLKSAYNNGQTITLPESGNIILFKILKLGDDYTPQMSEIIQAEVISYSTDSQQLHLNIIHGADEFSIPSGKFALNEDDEAIISRELNWNEMIEPRLLSSQNNKIM